MGKKGLYIIMLFLFAGIVLILPAYSQNIPEPKPKIHCSYDGNWYSPEEYKIYCKPPQKPSYYIDYSEYNRWLCNNVRGAEKACWDPGKGGDFPSFSACESARRNALPYDARWQRMSRCVPYGSTGEGRTQPKPYEDSMRKEQERRLFETRMKEFEEAQRQREALRKLEEERMREQIYKEKDNAGAIYFAMLDERPPVYSANPERYNRALQQAYCLATQSIKAAEMALNGNFDLSKNLMTDIESARNASEKGFDSPIEKINDYKEKIKKVGVKQDDLKKEEENDQHMKEVMKELQETVQETEKQLLKLEKEKQVIERKRMLAGCPQEISFKIPEVKMAIEEDRRYIQFNNITETIKNLLPKIEANYLETSKLKQRKQELLEKINDYKEKIKKEEKDDQLIKEAMRLNQEAEKEFQEVTKREQELIKEKQDIENKLNGLKTAINNIMETENK